MIMIMVAAVFFVLGFVVAEIIRRARRQDWLFFMPSKAKADLYRRIEKILHDRRSLDEHMAGVIEDLVRILVKQLKGSHEQVNILFKSNMVFAQRLNEADNEIERMKALSRQ